MPDLDLPLLTEFRRQLGPILASFGFCFLQHLILHRRHVIELSNGNRKIYVNSEGGVVVVELIVPDSAGRFWRVDVAGALWYSGIRTMPRAGSIERQLAIYSAEIERVCGKFLRGDVSVAIDARFCFLIEEGWRPW